MTCMSGTAPLRLPKWPRSIPPSRASARDTMSACAEKGLSMYLLLVLALLLLMPVHGEAVTLSWNYGTTPALRGATTQKPPQAKPTAAPVMAPGDTFVVARSLNGGSWGDIGTVPLRLGTNNNYEDTTLPASA